MQELVLAELKDLLIVQVPTYADPPTLHAGRPSEPFSPAPHCACIHRKIRPGLFTPTLRAMCGREGEKWLSNRHRIDVESMCFLRNDLESTSIRPQPFLTVPTVLRG